MIDRQTDRQTLFSNIQHWQLFSIVLVFFCNSGFFVSLLEPQKGGGGECTQGKENEGYYLMHKKMFQQLE